MMITVTRVGGDGSVLTWVVRTGGQRDLGRWERLAGHAALDVPPPYRPRPGEPVYEIRAGEQAVQVAEQDLPGPLGELVMAVLAENDA
jgi:hypothetical protein